MNSVFSIGQHIVFIENGNKLWEGSQDTILASDCEALNAFMASARRLMSAGTSNCDE